MYILNLGKQAFPYLFNSTEVQFDINKPGFTKQRLVSNHAASGLTHIKHGFAKFKGVFVGAIQSYSFRG